MVIDLKYINKVCIMIERGEVNWKGMWKYDGGIMIYDSIQYLFWFMVDCLIVGMFWVEVFVGVYDFIYMNKQFNCQFEVVISY